MYALEFDRYSTFLSFMTLASFFFVQILSGEGKLGLVHVPGPIITICCWTDIMSVRTKFQLCMVRRNTKAIRHKQKLELTFTNIDLTNVRCQIVKAGSQYDAGCCVALRQF